MSSLALLKWLIILLCSISVCLCTRTDSKDTHMHTHFRELESPSDHHLHSTVNWSHVPGGSAAGRVPVCQGSSLHAMTFKPASGTATSYSLIPTLTLLYLLEFSYIWRPKYSWKLFLNTKHLDSYFKIELCSCTVCVIKMFRALIAKFYVPIISHKNTSGQTFYHFVLLHKFNFIF